MPGGLQPDTAPDWMTSCLTASYDSTAWACLSLAESGLDKAGLGHVIGGDRRVRQKRTVAAIDYPTTGDSMPNLRNKQRSHGRTASSAPSARKPIDLPATLAAKAKNTMASYRIDEREQIAEILRVLSAKPQEFRLQFLGAADSAGTAVRIERSIWAPDAPTAVSMAFGAAVPADSAGIRVVDHEGCTVFERQGADFCGA
jgi:hypothetical protein